MEDTEENNNSFEDGFIIATKLAANKVVSSDLSKQAKLYVLRLMVEALNEVDA